jgi:hypothetical protein
MREINWRRPDLDGVLQGLVVYMQQFPTGSARYRMLHATFRSLGNAALAEEPFVIAVTPTATPKYDPRYQRVVDEVRMRRDGERRAR